MLRQINPPTVHAPASRYSQAIEAPENCRWLYISGQIGTAPDGTIEQGFRAQAERVFANINASLKVAGMGMGDLVRLNAFVTRREDVAAYRELRDTILGSAKPASTMVIAELINPDWLIEVEAVAAKEV